MSEANPTCSNFKTLNFMVLLSFICALVLSLLASALKQPQEEARELYRSKQLLLSAQIFHPDGYFQIRDKQGEYIPAKHIGNGILAPGTVEDIASAEDVLSIYRKRVEPFLVDAAGKEFSFEQAHLDLETYIRSNKKGGYAHLPYKLAYRVFPNPMLHDTQKKEYKPECFVIPVSGFGLWDFIYGFIALDVDGNRVIGIAWYEHKETPGLGANIAEAYWQKQFPGKRIFQPDASGKTDFNNTTLGISVIKGKVSEVMPNNPRSVSFADGMSGATLTGNGVTKAYKDTLEPYRPFLLRLQAENGKAK